jgi:hypothetical protein
MISQVCHPLQTTKLKSSRHDRPGHDPVTAGTAERAEASLEHVRTSPALAYLTRAETLRRVKILADRTLLFVTVGSLAWALTGTAYIEKWSRIDKSTLSLHLAGGPGIELTPLDGTRYQPSTYTLGVTKAVPSSITVIARIPFINNSPRAVTVRAASLSGPFLAGAPALAPGADGRVSSNRSGYVEGSVTVQCAATGSLAADATQGIAHPDEGPTVLTMTVVTADMKSHQVTLTIDDTAYAIQGRACS